MEHVDLPATTHIGLVGLKVADLERSLAFYRDLLGLQEVAREGATAWLAARPEGPLLIALHEWPNARPKPRGTTGLYHVAIRLPNRTALARLFKRLADHSWPFHGFSDHKVSEAIYLPDPDENGLELYCDRPQEEWPWRNGQLAMRTDPLDVDSLLREAAHDPSPWEGIHPDTDIGHVHVHVADLQAAEHFYWGTLGLRVMQRDYPGALFFAAGGYHHHVGTNIWAGSGAPPPPPEAVGLHFFTLVVPDDQAVEAIAKQAERTGHLRHQGVGEIWAEDGAGNVVRVAPDDVWEPRPMAAGAA